MCAGAQRGAPMADWQIQLIGLLLILAAVCLALGLAFLLFDQRRRLQRRPVWERMLASTRDFTNAMRQLFVAQGYVVVHSRALPDPTEDEPRDVVFELRRGRQTYMALCGRWVIPITSDQITRFEQALATVPSAGGLIVTTSFFSEAALERAQQLARVTLYDGEQVRVWLDEYW